MQFGNLEQSMASRLHEWLRSQIGCLFGRRSYQRGEFIVAAVHCQEDLRVVRQMFRVALLTDRKASCLVLIEPENQELLAMRAACVVDYLNRYYFSDACSGSKSYRLCIRLRCPVTGCDVVYNDFDQVAFYPQAIDNTDPLYDPSMYCPFVAINITSDTYAFSLVVAEKSLSLYGRAPTNLTTSERAEVFSHSLSLFQRMAERTVQNYAVQTDTALLCPIHMTFDKRFYVAPHDEAAFAEYEKVQHINEMPLVYCARIIQQWTQFFEFGRRPDFSEIYVPSTALVTRE